MSIDRYIDKTDRYKRQRLQKIEREKKKLPIGQISDILVKANQLLLSLSRKLVSKDKKVFFYIRSKMCQMMSCVSILFIRMARVLIEKKTSFYK